MVKAYVVVKCSGQRDLGEEELLLLEGLDLPHPLLPRAGASATRFAGLSADIS